MPNRLLLFLVLLGALVFEITPESPEPVRFLLVPSGLLQDFPLIVQGSISDCVILCLGRGYPHAVLVHSRPNQIGKVAIRLARWTGVIQSILRYPVTGYIFTIYTNIQDTV